jgi:hypothetical protein
MLNFNIFNNERINILSAKYTEKYGLANQLNKMVEESAELIYEAHNNEEIRLFSTLTKTICKNKYKSNVYINNQTMIYSILNNVDKDKLALEIAHSYFTMNTIVHAYKLENKVDKALLDLFKSEKLARDEIILE